MHRLHPVATVRHVAGCCDPSGYRGAFNRATAEKSVRAFHKRGLDSTAAPMLAALSPDLQDATVIEVGAGAGTAMATMLESGARRAIGVDISPNYAETAHAFLEQRGHSDSIEWHTGDFVALAGDLPQADVVFLNRVVCCYPAMHDLVDAAMTSSSGRVAISYPRDRLMARLVVRLINTWLRINRNGFRVFVHDPGEITRRLQGAGFRTIETGTTSGWHWGVWARAGSRP